MVTYGMTTRYSGPVEAVTVSEFFQGVLNTLRYWRDVHTQADTWAAQWLMDGENMVNMDEVRFASGCYEIPLDVIKKGIVEIQMERDRVSPFYCFECGGEGEDRTCDECGAECSEQDAEFFLEITDFSSIPAFIVTKALEVYGFRFAEDALQYLIGGVLEDVNNYIEKLEKAETAYDKLAAMIQALSLAHTSGDIFEDYLHYGMYSMDWDDILNIRENGLISHFTAEEVKEFLEA